MARRCFRFDHHIVRGLFALALLLASAAQAAIPQTINYQGQLTNAGGQPVNAPSVMPLAMTLRIYNVLNGGAPLYSESQNVVVTNGVFNLLIGAVTPLTLDFSVPYFLEINPLPGLNPDYSDMVILARLMGMSYETLVTRIVNASLKRHQL